MDQLLEMHASEVALNAVEALRLWVLKHTRDASTTNHRSPQVANGNQEPSCLKDAMGAAEYLGVVQKTLSNWRSLGLGLTYLKIDGRVAYDLHALRAFIENSSASELTKGACLKMRVPEDRQG